MAFTEGSNNGVLNSTTAVTLVAGPASGQRIVKSITVQQKDTAAVTLTLLYNDNGTPRQIGKWLLDANDTLLYNDVLVLDAATRSVQAVLAAAVATNQPEFVAHYGDATT